jgi:hypothetical protein
MRAFSLGIGLVVLFIGTGCTTTQARSDLDQGLAVHSCSKSPFLRSVGLFGGEQPEIFLKGANLRREPPPSADGATRVLDVTGIDNLKDTSAEPAIDKCGSWLHATRSGEIEVTILWRDHNCPFSFDEDQPDDCRSRATFSFSPKDLGVLEVLGRGEDPDSALRRLLIVDAYFTREVDPEERHPATGVPTVPRSNVYLVVRVIPAARGDDAQAATADVAAVESPRRS